MPPRKPFVVEIKKKRPIVKKTTRQIPLNHAATRALQSDAEAHS